MSKTEELSWQKTKTLSTYPTYFEAIVKSRRIEMEVES